MNTKKYISAVAVLATIAGLALAIPAFADTTAPASTPAHRSMNGAWAKGGMMRPAVFGTVSAISGDTITVTGKQFTKPTTPGTAPAAPTTVTYTVDATNATVTKANAASTVGAIAVGDTIAVEGTVSGTNVTATTIRDGVMPGGMNGGMGGMNRGKMASSTPATPVIAGNGEPIVAGKVTAISGSTLTITNASNVTYTVDATNAQVAQGNTLSSLANVKVGDSVVVQGTVNGNAITAYSVTDSAKPATATGVKGLGARIFGGISQFFSHLFGF